MFAFVKSFFNTSNRIYYGLSKNVTIIADYCWMNYKKLEALVVSCPCRNNSWKINPVNKKGRSFCTVHWKRENKRDGKWIQLHLRASFTQSLKRRLSQELQIDKKQAKKWPPSPSSTFSCYSNFLILFVHFVIDEGKIGLWSNPSVFRSLAAAQGYDSGRLINRWIGRRRYPGIIWLTERWRGEGNIYLNSNYPHLRLLMLSRGQLSAGWASTLHFKHSSAPRGHPRLGRRVHILKRALLKAI